MYEAFYIDIYLGCNIFYFDLKMQVALSGRREDTIPWGTKGGKKS